MNPFMVQPGAWPGLSADMQQAASAIYAYQGVDPNVYNSRPHSFFHRLLYPAVGSTALSLFNVSPSPFVCNLPLQGQIANETFMRLDAVRIHIQTGITSPTDNTRVAAGSQFAAAVTPNTVAEEIRTIMEAGALTIKIGDKTIVDGVYGLTKFPSGCGLTFSAALSGTAAAAQAIPIANGVQDTQNAYRLLYPILPGKVISGSLNWSTLLTVTTAFVMRVELCGQFVSPSNL